MITGWWTDLRFAARKMRRAPGFTATVVLTTAMAIGANAVIFTVVNAVLIRPLPFGDPATLVQVAEKNDKLNLPSFGVSVLNFLDWREQSHSFQQMGAISFSNYTLTGSGEPEQFSGNLISPSFLSVLGLKPVLGRGFNPEEERPGSAPVAMIGEGVWKRRFGGDPSVVGRTLALDGQSTLVVGIAPAALNLISNGDIYTPLIINPATEIRLNHVNLAFARLKPGVTMSQAQAEMNAISLHMGQVHPEIHDWGIRILTVFETFVNPSLKTGLLVLLGAVGLVLLIACANIANLLLSRAATREKEMAVRTALGATRSGLIRQMLIESSAMSISGGMVGIVAALAAVRILNRVLPAGVLPVPDIAVDATVLWFAFGLTVLTGLLFGMAPALRNAQVNPERALRQEGRGAIGGARARLRDSLVAGELALATMLLIGAGLLIESLAKLESVRLGFEPQGILTFQISPPAAKYPQGTQAPALYRSILDTLNAIPGVRGTAIASSMPFGPNGYPRHPMLTTGPSVLPAGTKIPIDWSIVSTGYFHLMGIPLLAGRSFSDSDTATSTPAILVSHSTAKRFWGEDNPIGRALRPSAKPELAFTVIGVVGDVRDTALSQESPALYYVTTQRQSATMEVAVRTDGNPEAMLGAISHKVHDIDADLALSNVRTEEEWIATSAAQPRFNSMLLGAFAAVALLMAAIGIYGVLAYSVNQRTREIGVRMALGAQRANVVRLIVREGMTVALIGIALGLIGAFGAGQFLSTLVYGVTVRDPLTFASVAVALAAVALAACIVPARRASRVDPMEALRYE